MAPQSQEEALPRGHSARAPRFVSLFNPIVHWLMGAGIPFGPNALITIRGRKTGQLRTTPVAVIQVDGRRWVSGPFGDVNWMRNLRAAGEAIITSGRRQEPVKAVELTEDEAAAFFADVLGPFVRRLPLGKWLIGSVLGGGDILDDPVGAARRHPVFELLPRDQASASTRV